MLFALAVQTSWGLEPLRTVENGLATASGTPVILRGVSVTNQFWGRWIWPRSDSIQAAGGIPMIRYTRTVDWFLDSLDFQNLRDLGPNVVRYEFSYELFDSSNAARDSNLQDLHLVVDRFASMGVYTLLCMSGHPGLDVAKQAYEDAKPGSRRVASVFESDSVEDLWSRTWSGLAESFQGNPSIAGFEVLNEPRLPSTKDISRQGVAAKLVDLVERIGSIDPGRLVFIPEFNSREADSGESYWSNAQQRTVVDRGEQGIIWTPVWPDIPDSVANVVSVFHAYFPWDFVDQGIGTFSESEYRAHLRKRLEWPRAHRRPVAVTEYGASHKLVLDGKASERLAWYAQAHRAFAAESLSTCAFTFKGEVTPYTGTNEYSLWVQYRNAKAEVRIMDGAPVFQSGQLEEAAIRNSFDTVMVRWLIQDGRVSDRSPLGNGPILDELSRYFEGSTIGVKEPSPRSKAPRLLRLKKGAVRAHLPEGATSWSTIDPAGRVVASGVVEPGETSILVGTGSSGPTWLSIESSHGRWTGMMPSY